MAKQEVDADPRKELEGGQRAAGNAAGDAEEGECRGRTGEADESCRRAARLRKEFQHRTGDHAERALGADEEVAEVVAGVVLAEAP